MNKEVFNEDKSRVATPPGGDLADEDVKTLVCRVYETVKLKSERNQYGKQC